MPTTIRRAFHFSTSQFFAFDLRVFNHFIGSPSRNGIGRRGTAFSRDVRLKKAWRASPERELITCHIAAPTFKSKRRHQSPFISAPVLFVGVIRSRCRRLRAA